MSFEPQVMCENCQTVFPSAASKDDTVICPACQHEGKPGRVMKVTGFPSLETFKRNWQKVKEIEDER